MGLSDILNAVRGGFAPTDLYQLPTRQLTLNEDDGANIIFKELFAVCVDLEIENLHATNTLTYTIDGLDSADIVLGVGGFKAASRTITKSIHIKTANPDYIIRCAVVDIFQAAKIPGVDV